MMDYSDNTSKIDRVIIGRKADGRFAMSEEDEAKLLAEIKEGLYNNKTLAEEYGCSVSKVWNLRNPEKYAENKRKRNEMDVKKYYTKKKLAETKRKHRAKKKKMGKEK